MSQNNIQIGRFEWKITGSLMVVIAASFASAITATDHGLLAGSIPAFIALLASMYLLSTAFRFTGRIEQREFS